MNPLRQGIRSFDAWLSRQQAIHPFTEDRDCLLRWQLAHLRTDLTLPHGAIPPGTPVILFHLWNERIPAMPAQGADLAWSLRFYRRIRYSLHLAAIHLHQTSELEQVRAIGGITAHFGSAQEACALFERLGFSIYPYHRPLGAFGEFWENFYTWWLIWAYNPASLGHRKFWRLKRVEFWTSREAFLQTYLG